MRSVKIKDTTREERIRIVQQGLWDGCASECEFCSGCDNRGGGQKELWEINAEYRAPLVKG